MPETMRFAVYPTPELAIRAAADLFTALAPQTVALAGGSTPKELYGLLASDDYRDRTDWHELEIYYSDERAVPPNHPDSNYGMSRRALLDLVPVQPDSRVPDGGRRLRSRERRRPVRPAVAAAPRPGAARHGHGRPHGQPVPRRRRLRRAGAPLRARHGAERLQAAHPDVPDAQLVAPRDLPRAGPREARGAAQDPGRRTAAGRPGRTGPRRRHLDVDAAAYGDA